MVKSAKEKPLSKTDTSLEEVGDPAFALIERFMAMTKSKKERCLLTSRSHLN